MTARICLIPGAARGHRPRLQFAKQHSTRLFVQSHARVRRKTRRRHRGFTIIGDYVDIGNFRGEGLSV